MFLLFLIAFSRDLVASIKSASVIAMDIFRPLLYFVMVAGVIQSVYSIALSEPRLMLFWAFIAFNFIYCCGIYAYLTVYRQHGAAVVFVATLTALTVASGGLFTGDPETSYRQTSWFNNANQLGYFALLAASVLALCRGRIFLRYSGALALVAVFACVYLSAASLSKAAMLSTAFAVALFIPRLGPKEIVVLGIAIAGVSPSLIDRVVSSLGYERVMLRVSDVGRQSDDSLAGRGYDRIVESSHLLLFGAGEGAYERFVNRDFTDDMEIHSTIASVVFCYGVPGLLALLCFGYRCYKLAPWQFCVVFLPVLAYGLTHNGLRFGYLWLLVALFVFFAERGSFLVPASRQSQCEPGGVQMPLRRRHRPCGFSTSGGTRTTSA